MSTQATVTIQNAPTGPTAPAAATTTERPAWLPEKFKSPEDFAKSYTELEKRLGTPAPEPTPAVTDPAKAEQQAMTPGKLDLTKYEQEIASTGKLADESFKALEAAGLPRSMVEGYIQGQAVQAQAKATEIHNALGGAEKFSTVMQWAAANATPAERTAYNNAVKSGDTAAIKLAAQGLAARHAQAFGTDPSLVGGARPSNSGVAPFANWDQVTRAMSDGRYSTDAAYREEVASRIAVSKNL